jgi:hypothetical protein
LHLKQREASRKEFDQLIANAKEMNVNNIRTLCLFALNFGTKMSEEDKQRHVRFRHIFYLSVFLYLIGLCQIQGEVDDADSSKQRKHFKRTF